MDMHSIMLDIQLHTAYTFSGASTDPLACVMLGAQHIGSSQEDLDPNEWHAVDVNAVTASHL